MNGEHRVLLCGCALEILDEARKLMDGTSPFIFSESSRSPEPLGPGVSIAGAVTRARLLGLLRDPAVRI